MKIRNWLIAFLAVLLPILAQAQGTPPGIVTTNQLGAANGAAPLDGTAKVPTANLPSVATQGGLAAANNLSDVASAATARSNLGAVSVSAPNITAPLNYNGVPAFTVAYGTYIDPTGKLASCSNNCVTLGGVGAGANLSTNEYLATAFGFHALGAATTSQSQATVFGARAGSLLSGSGPYFVSLFGINALGECVTLCTNDSIFGNDAAVLATALTNSQGVGNYVFQQVTSQPMDSVQAFGEAAVRWNATATGAQYLIGIGNQALFGNNATTANDLIAIGDHSLFNPTSAHAGIAIGQLSGENASSDSSFVWVGRNVGINAAGTSNTVGIGAFALASSSFTGFNVVAVGSSSGTALTSGYQDNFFGAFSCKNATTANSILCLGDNVGATVTTGTGIVLLSSGHAAVEPTASNFSMNIENIITATGTAVPSTSITTIAGIENVVGVRQANGTAGVSCGGAPTASFASVSGIVTHC